jgi:hypothetical protein
MDIKEARTKISVFKELLLEIKEVCYINEKDFEPNENGDVVYSGSESMDTINPDKDRKLKDAWGKVQENTPSGFSVSGNLLRHISFNESRDWFDIANHDVPRELKKVDDYLAKLNLVEYIEGLHPKVRRANSNILDGDYDAALKVVFTGLDTYIRSVLKINGSISTVNQIGKAFNDGVLQPSSSDHKDAMRNFLQGVIGYYRNIIAHNELVANRNSLQSCLSLFGVAHEAFIMIDYCSRNIED